MTEYHPDNWAIVKINDGKDNVHCKVLAGWSGGYLTGSSWKMNSGITKVIKDGDYWLFHGASGSIYRCYKGSECLSMNTAHIWDSLQKLHGDKVKLIHVDEIVLVPK